ncbi:MAG: TetR/AcrR family transcriptional regulator [Alkalicoccus sp.]|nr:MAG: TetR/AcrR family transcriptional regulator [Alkalicoccus sp.]
MPKKIDPEERKMHIFEAACRVIYQHGFEKTTLREIAREAGLSLSSVQHFFPKQKAIYMYAMDVILDKYRARMKRASRVGENGYENAVQQIKQIVHASTEEERMENDIWVKFSMMAVMNADYMEKKDKLREINVEYAESVLDMLQMEGYIKDSSRLQEQTNSLIVFLHGLVFESVIYRTLYDETVVEREIRGYLAKICAEKK